MAVFYNSKGKSFGALAPEQALKILEERSQVAQSELATRDDAGPDVLHYLAEHGEPATRRAVAANHTAPASANRILADDPEEEVRAELAVKIARLMPGLSERENESVVALTIETLERLAQDSAVRVRAILAEEIKTLTCVPKQLVKTLAQDAEIIVAGPVLEYSPLLSDADLMEVIASGRVDEALVAVARRRPLSAKLSDAVFGTLDIPAVAALLVNPDAKIREKTLDKIIAQAETIDAWHRPLVLRSEISNRAMRRIAAFVGSGLIAQLAARRGLNEGMRAHLNRVLRARLEADEIIEPPAIGDSAENVVAEAQKDGRLDDNFIESAAEAGHREIVTLALAALANAPAATVRRMLIAGTAKPITALVWHAGLSMRAAFKIQSFVMKLPAGELLPARGGVGFPLSNDEMRWHLNYFDIRAA
jgi:uncharacterized protein (DUF2336 family)